MASCFLRTQAEMSAMAAAVFAKQLCATPVFTVNDFLCLTHAECEAQELPPAAVMRLDRCLQQFPHLPTNRHAALGTRGCCAWLVPLHSPTPPVWCASAVPITRLPVRMFCDAPCHVQSLLVCHVGCPPLCAGARACDVRGAQQRQPLVRCVPFCDPARAISDLLTVMANAIMCRWLCTCLESRCSKYCQHGDGVAVALC